MRIRALKTYRCGEPPGGSTTPPKDILELMVKLLGGGRPAPGASPEVAKRPPCPRIIAGAVYQTFPVELGAALIKAGAAEEVDGYGNAIKRSPAKKEKK